jgi:NADH:ubiquinone oxidoreductase subunit K
MPPDDDDRSYIVVAWVVAIAVVELLIGVALLVWWIGGRP